MNKLRILGLAGVLGMVASAGTITLPGTGQNVVGGLDQNYQITSDTTGLYTGTVPGDAVIVTNLPAVNNTVVWDTLPGTQWIGPAANQYFTSSGFVGATMYQTTFSVTNTANASLDFFVLVDNAVNIFLNGTEVANVGAGNDQYKGFLTPTFISIGTNFVSGTNFLDFQVLNGGNATGLDISNTPEPSTLTLAGVALAAVGLLRFRKRRAA